jgi:hypothetical protein
VVFLLLCNSLMMPSMNVCGNSSRALRASVFWSKETWATVLYDGCWQKEYVGGDVVAHAKFDGGGGKQLNG